MEETHFTSEDRATLSGLTKVAAILETKLDRAILDISSMTNNFAKQSDMADHEIRLRSLEKHTEDYATVKKLVYGAVGFILLAVLSSIIYLVIKQ